MLDDAASDHPAAMLFLFHFCLDGMIGAGMSRPRAVQVPARLAALS